MKLHSISTYVSTVSVFLTILLGGLVHSMGAGLACPDWPLCFGKVMPKMQGAVLVEHSHRLIAGATGILIWITGILFWIDTSRTSVQRSIISGAMILVVIQSIFGGLTVLMELPDWVSTSHFFLANLTFLFMISLCWSISTNPEKSTSRPHFVDQVFVIAGFIILYIQMVLGAWLRHIGTKGEPFTFNCETFPLCDPVWTEAMTNFYELTYWSHRTLGVVLTFLFVLVTYRFFRFYRNNFVHAYHLTLINSILIFIQVLLGALTVRSFLAVTPVMLHLITAEILFVSTFILLLEITQPDFLRNTS